MLLAEVTTWAKFFENSGAAFASLVSLLLLGMGTFFLFFAVPWLLQFLKHSDNAARTDYKAELVAERQLFASEQAKEREDNRKNITIITESFRTRCNEDAKNYLSMFATQQEVFERNLKEQSGLLKDIHDRVCRRKNEPQDNPHSGG